MSTEPSDPVWQLAALAVASDADADHIAHLFQTHVDAEARASRAKIDLLRATLERWLVQDAEGYSPDEGHAYTPTLHPDAEAALEATK